VPKNAIKVDPQRIVLKGIFLVSSLLLIFAIVYCCRYHFQMYNYIINWRYIFYACRNM